MASWQIIESGRLLPDAIMAKDAFLLEQLESNPFPILHCYEWQNPCLTYGYFTDPSRYLDFKALEECGLQMARRPTGGGMIFHLSDFAFSILIPANHPRFSLNTLENYAFINQKVAEIVSFFTQHSLQPQLLPIDSPCSSQDCHAFCMAKPTQYDLIIEGKKIGGAAQRRTRFGLLHQASLSLLFPPLEILCRVLKNYESVLEAMQMHSYCMLNSQTTTQQLQEARIQLKNLLQQFIHSL